MGLLAPCLSGDACESDGCTRRHALSGETGGRGTVMAAWLLALLLAGGASASQQIPTGSYQVDVLETAPPRIAVRATLPSSGELLTMAMSRSADVPEIADAGWPGLIRNLSVVDPDGHAVGVTSAGAAGWKLARPISGSLTVRYEVDYAPLAQRGWPAPRETAYADSDHIVVIGRSLFITTPAQQASTVRFSLPPGWQHALPWLAKSVESKDVVVASTEDLTENLLAFLEGPPDVLSAEGFDLKVVALGHWRGARGEVRRVLGAALQRLVAMIGFEGHGGYLVVLLPQSEGGGESFRASFALNSEETPARANLSLWGNTIAHEIFHYWNGWRLRGADYASSQWFQEGVTEYAANLALVSARVIDHDEFYGKLAKHVTNYRRLATPLDAPGTHKGPPLYSGGALVAFMWDATIRERSRGERGLGDVLRVLLQKTGDGARPYEWSDIQAALETVAQEDWAEFHRRFIHGTEPLPLAGTFSRLGLVITGEGDAAVNVEVDPAAPEAAHVLRRAVLSGNR
jgi:predicted metalloprotease with PDZ domain